MAAIRMTQVTALVIHAIGVGHRYGFDIMDATGLASGSVYPVLRRLEDARLVRGRWEDAPASQRAGRPQRRLYELTRAGEEAQEAAREKLMGARTVILAEAPEPEG